jgi:hypothetical protein
MVSMRPKLVAPIATFALAAIAAPVAHAEGEVVPPGNSAVIQYTETIPSAGGQKDAEGKKGKVKPADVLGDSTTRKLESKGKAGREVAEFTAETAPAPVSGHDQTSSTPAQEKSEGDKKQKSHGAAPPDSSGGGGNGTEGATELGPAHGSSALGQIAGQATGTSSGELGLLLPLIVLGAAGWAAAYYWRRRHRIA